METLALSALQPGRKAGESLSYTDRKVQKARARAASFRKWAELCAKKKLARYLLEAYTPVVGPDASHASHRGWHTFLIRLNGFSVRGYASPGLCLADGPATNGERAALPRAKPQPADDPSEHPELPGGQGWTARPYQQDAMDAFDSGVRRMVLIWHRRAGKDNFALNLAGGQMVTDVGTYWHLFPMHVQAKRAIWNGIDNSGQRFIDQAFPRSLRAATRSQDMQIEYKNGSMWQLCGSDAYDRLVGANPRGVTFSEWALCDPRAWDYIRPIIRENGGWAAFITTYRGRNHAYQMAKRLARNPDWYVDVRTVDDTTHHDGRQILTPADIQAERDEGMSEALIRQEYYCDPIAARDGSIYGKALEKMLEAGRLTNIGYDSSKQVFASWSLTWDNQYTVLFWQRVGNECRVIASKPFKFEALPDCIEYVATNYPWRYVSRHIVGPETPHDKVAYFEDRGLNIEMAPKIESIVTTTRDHIATTWIDNARRPWEPEDENNVLLVDALNGYRFSRTIKKDEYSKNPANTWEKHYAAAFESFSAWQQDAPNHLGGWHDRPSTDLYDRAAI